MSKTPDEMPDNVTDRPLVTFALFAYNQEKYIREAVEGAFAQTYEPLEIILSDDCSSDRTFEIMREMVATYDGPHRVKAKQTQRNMGVVPHVLLRGQEANGAIIVVAAGDDISLPERVDRLVSNFSKDTGCVFSNVSIIDINGCIISECAAGPLRSKEPENFIRAKKNKYPIILGCSAAYAPWVFELPISAKEKIYAEDLLFSFYINLVGGRITKIQQPLLLYREHDEALSNRQPRTTSFEEAEQENRFSSFRRLQMISDFRAIAANKGKTDSLNEARIAEVEAKETVINEWPDLSLIRRLKALVAFRPERSADLFWWKVVRIFGSFPRYQPRKIIHHIQKGINKINLRH